MYDDKRGLNASDAPWIIFWLSEQIIEYGRQNSENKHFWVIFPFATFLKTKIFSITAQNFFSNCIVISTKLLHIRDPLTVLWRCSVFIIRDKLLTSVGTRVTTMIFSYFAMRPQKFEKFSQIFLAAVTSVKCSSIKYMMPNMF